MPEQKFRFWKENRNDGHYTLTEGELIAKFTAWLNVQERAFLECYPIGFAVAIFIADKREHELNSTPEENSFIKIVELLRPIRRRYLDAQQPQEIQ